MSSNWNLHLERWQQAGLVDATAAERIRAWEREHNKSEGLRWPVLLALAFGAVLLCAGVLLFVSAHWDELSPAQRMTMVVAMVAVFHCGGAAARKTEGLSVALHAVGTITLGAGIALAGQIFNLQEHWPAAILMWALGAAIAWALLRDWAQAALCAILFPWWLVGEAWTWRYDQPSLAAAVGLAALSFTYLSVRRTPQDTATRKAVAWIGGLALLPSVFSIVAMGLLRQSDREPAIFWVLAIAVPVAAAALLRGRQATWNLVAVGWTWALAGVCDTAGGATWPHDNIGTYAWCALGAVALTAWGVLEARVERINLGIVGFAITLMAFYFSQVMDKLGRSVSLLVLGALFLGGGWALDRVRRKLTMAIHAEAI